MNLHLAVVWLGILASTALCTPMIEGLWQKWKEEHAKVYSGTEDEQTHKNLWMVNYHNIKSHNEGGSSYTVGLNQFSDMSGKEYQQMILNEPIGMHTKSDKEKFHETSSRCCAPDLMDWRNFGFVTKVKSQGRICKSSWAFSAAGALEAQYRKVWGKLIALSEQQLIDCSKGYGNKGCGGGTVQNAFTYVKHSGGICAENTYSYLGYGWYCVSKFCKKVTSCIGYVNIDPANEGDLLDAIYTVGPVSVSIDASDYNFRYYRSGIYCNHSCSKTDLNYSLLVVGYGSDDNQEYWILKNSWGTSWGQNGYMYMARNQNNTCGIASAASYPTVIFT